MQLKSIIKPYEPHTQYKLSLHMVLYDFIKRIIRYNYCNLLLSSRIVPSTIEVHNSFAFSRFTTALYIRLQTIYELYNISDGLHMFRIL